MRIITHHVELGDEVSACGVEVRRLSMGGGEITTDIDEVNCRQCLEWIREDCTADAGPAELRLGEQERAA